MHEDTGWQDESPAVVEKTVGHRRGEREHVVAHRDGRESGEGGIGNNSHYEIRAIVSLLVEDVEKQGGERRGGQCHVHTLEVRLLRQVQNHDLVRHI
jgi:hypothetical protein